MNGRGLFGAFAAIVLIAVIAGLGIGAYNAGVNEGIAEAARAAQAAGDAAPVVYPPYAGGPWGYGYGNGWGGGGFGFFGFLLFILGFFLFIGLIRAAFGWGRSGGGGRGHGGWDGRRERMEEYHRELHRRDEPQGSSS